MTDAPGSGDLVTPDAGVRQVSDALWRGMDRYRGMLDVTEFGDVLLLLLYLRCRPAWEVLNASGLDVERALRADLSADGQDVALLQPLLQSIYKAGELGQLALLAETVEGHASASDVLPPGQLFSAVLEATSLAVGRKGGEFHTPETITDLAAELLDPAQTDRIFDPCCKAGAFPAAIADRLASQGKDASHLAVDISDHASRSVALAYLNLRLRGIAPHVLPRPILTPRTGTPDQLYDIVTANPPFNLKWNGDDRNVGRWRYGVPPAHNANFAWLQYVAASLDRGGRAAVVMPHSAGLSENAHERNIRAAMLDDGVVSAIISLPSQLFTATDIPVTLWLLQSSWASRPGEVLFVDATQFGTIQQRGRRAFTRSDIDQVAAAYRQWRERHHDAVAGLAMGVTLDEIRADGYRLNPRAHISPIDTTPDLVARVQEVGELVQRLRRLNDQVVGVDRRIEDHLKEISL